MNTSFDTAYAAFAASTRSAEDEVTFYSSTAYQNYYTEHFNTSYEEYSTFTLDELMQEEEILNDLRQTSSSLLYQIHNMQGLGCKEYRLCCELDAELDALHAAYRRHTRSKSF